MLSGLKEILRVRSEDSAANADAINAARKIGSGEADWPLYQAMPPG